MEWHKICYTMYNVTRIQQCMRAPFAKKSSILTYLNININRISNEKNIATLSIVRNMTNSCRRKFGINRTSFRIRNRRNVRKTLNPELPSLMPKNCWPNSNTLYLSFVWAQVSVRYREFERARMEKRQQKSTSNNNRRHEHMKTKKEKEIMKG